jgi:5-methyltetrahydropteroyltriglutamate--homocysteine methyltransferase
MKCSTERILTTHAGSLARPPDLLQMIRTRAADQPYDQAALAGRVRSAVAEVVRQQLDAGVDVVSDGEVGKPGFANYVKDRLTGIVARDGLPPRIFSDRADFPDFEAPGVLIR